MKNLLRTPLKGFSLLETSMVLVIAGIMFSAVLKGKNVLDQAKIRQVVYDFSHIQTAVALYANTYGEDLFANLEDAWVKLSQTDLWASSTPPASKLGGRFTFCTLSQGTYVKLSTAEGAAFLTAKQVRALVNQLPNESSESVLILDSSQNPVELSQVSVKEKGRFSVALKV